MYTGGGPHQRCRRGAGAENLQAMMSVTARLDDRDPGGVMRDIQQ
ncbi:hypothetical protein [Hymenobacter sp. DG01]|nr:hypothetical protein [Hymenobacter sp. DG01]